MPVDMALHSHDHAFRRQRNAWAVSAINQRRGGVEEDIHHAAVIRILAVGDAGKQFCQFWADAGQA